MNRYAMINEYALTPLDRGKTSMYRALRQVRKKYIVEGMDGSARIQKSLEMILSKYYYESESISRDYCHATSSSALCSHKAPQFIDTTKCFRLFFRYFGGMIEMRKKKRELL